jgi:adenine phosphoribosyltransferase
MEDFERSEKPTEESPENERLLQLSKDSSIALRLWLIVSFGMTSIRTHDPKRLPPFQWGTLLLDFAINLYCKSLRNTYDVMYSMQPTQNSKLETQNYLKAFIRDVPDFPQAGILFRDIAPLLENGEAFGSAITGFRELLKDEKIDKIVAVESRGFIFGAPLAQHLGVGFAMARKKGKLPSDKVSVSYDLEYGTNTIEMHSDSIKKGERILIIDDVLATGGTAGAAISLVEQLGGIVVGAAFLIELKFLEGRKSLSGRRVYNLVEYS